MNFSFVELVRKNFTTILFSSVLVLAVILAYAQFAVPVGLTEDGALMFTRYTARLSFIFFLPVFTLAAIHHFKPTETSRFLMRHRRQLGLAFALAHSIHFGAILLLLELQDDWFSSDDAGALAIYFFMGLMAATSNEYSMRKLRKVWRWLHTFGLYGIFIGFFVTYTGRIQGYDSAPLAESLKDPLWVYILLATVVTAAWMLRIAAFWSKRSSTPASQRA